MSLRDLREAWNRFFFAPEGVEAIALFRVAIGALMVLWSLLMAPDFLVWYGENGILPWRAVSASLEPLNLWPVARWVSARLGGGDDAAAIAIWVVGLVAGATLMVGLRSRLSAALAWLAVLSLTWRNQYIFNGGDTLLRLFLMYLIVSPAGRAYSLDARRLARLGRPLPREHAPWALRLVQLQISWVYLVAFWTKLAGTTWLDGSAVYYVLRSPHFQRFPLPEFLDQSLLVSQLLSWSTLAVEFAMFTLIWIKELRRYVVVAGVLLHLGIEYTMNIAIFELVMLAGYIVFVEPATWRRWVARASARLRTGSPAASAAADGRSS